MTVLTFYFYSVETTEVFNNATWEFVQVSGSTFVKVTDGDVITYFNAGEVRRFTEETITE